MKSLENYSVKLVLKFGMAFKTFRRYVDRSGSRNNATKLLKACNGQGPQIQFAMEYENYDKELDFLDLATRDIKSIS